MNEHLVHYQSDSSYYTQKACWHPNEHFMPLSREKTILSKNLDEITCDDCINKIVTPRKTIQVFKELSEKLSEVINYAK